MRLSRLLLPTFLFVSVVVAAGCPGPEYPKCESDEQCKKNKDGAAVEEYCLLGQCQECAKDSNCDAGERCNRGRCEQTCASDEQCGAGNICEANACTAAQCTTNDTCGTGATCEKGRCLRGTGTAGTTPAAGDETLDCKTSNRVQFEYNMSDLTPGARSTLDTLAKCMKKNASWTISVEGHADERGTPEYNLSLGETRAKGARKYLSALGVEEKRMKVVTYGEEKPLNTAGTEEAFAENRRAELNVKQ